MQAVTCVEVHEHKESVRVENDLTGEMEFQLLEVCLISFRTRAAYLRAIVKTLIKGGIGCPGGKGNIDVHDTLCSTANLPKLGRPEGVGCLRSALDRLSTLEIHAGIESASHFNFDHLMCIILASYIAGVGLLTDSDAFILASFFISPLMGMIMAVTWGCVIGDFGLSARGLRNMMYGFLATFFSGVSIGIFLSIPDNLSALEQPVFEGQGAFAWISLNTAQIASRGPPASNVYSSMVVAILSGVAIALGRSCGIDSLIP